MNRKQAGQIGGRATVAKHGCGHMSEIGKRGAATTWGRYRLEPVGQSGWAMVRKDTNTVRTFINYLPEKR